MRWGTRGTDPVYTHLVFDHVVLRSFLAVAEAGSFTQAAHRLRLRQSTVSQHVRRLETLVGRELFVRDTHSVVITGDGEAMVGFARNILEAQERAAAYFAGPGLRGRVRLGVSEDLVVGRLPEILRGFRLRHPLVDLELTVELSDVLTGRLRAGDLDLIFAKRRPGEEHGWVVWREDLVWVGAEGLRLDRDAPVPLIVYPPPSHTREHALNALDRASREWRIVCTSGSLNGLRAAALAGLGVAVFTRNLVPDGLVDVGADNDLPEPGAVDFVLASRRDTMREPVAALAEVIQAIRPQ
ncbi:LysR family transcriptional regulator [Streptoalloteichus hindustanus]|uniref:DNA-binding transcriptional regulator, LysR family n=1 Tax=Streptoalloteichus hindustanus TaxID=2017 RepID=A0A1M5NBS1_STRHI|nr:LysR family transcriptional regulator [Streptoalloteichus hindustanus]SHG86941.1 DNA-binding transcriptional regulator, LysR family [Streptoalloteichus hindustanus]